MDAGNLSLADFFGLSEGGELIGYRLDDEREEIVGVERADDLIDPNQLELPL